MSHKVHLAAIFQDAHLLSVVIKRDILSVRMSVIGNPMVGPACFDPCQVDSVWPEMGVQDDDCIIGLYNFGLQKLNETGDTFFITLPKVITSALLREVQQQQSRDIVQRGSP